MTSISSRATVFAVVKEVTEGTPVVPAGATDFIAIQDDFGMSPNFDSLENAELKSSIGKSKPIQGAENPTADGSFYLRHSGVEGQAPNYGDLLEACFGATATASTEYNTVAASTTTVIKVDAGEGATFERGEALLIKDGTNGYRIRCIDSIATDDLTIGFQVPTAPAVGVNLGKCSLYKPANSGHPTLSLWEYLGNGGATKLISGARVTSASFDIAAGELINGSYSLEGNAFYFNPVNITATDTKLDFTDDDGTWAATITAKMYNNPHELASALQTAMQSANAGETPTVTYSDSTGKFTIKTTGTVLSLLWNTGANTANTVGDKIGFSVAADDTGVLATTGYTSDNAISFAAPYTPSYDAADPLAAKDNEVMLGDSDDYVCFKAASVSVSIDTPKSNKPSVCAVSGIDGSIINERTATISISAFLDQYDADKWRRFKENSDTKFQYSFGTKVGGNWVAGKCGAIYVPTAVITSFETTDADGLVGVDIELQAFVNSTGAGEVYIGFV